MADETPGTKPPKRRIQRLEIVQPTPAPPPAAPPAPAPAPAPAASVVVAPAPPPKTPEEKRALARKLAGLPVESTPDTSKDGAIASTGRVVPLHARPEETADWWRNHVGALLLVSEGTGAPTEIRLEAVSPNGDYVRCRPTGATAFMWRPRTVVRLLDIIAYPEDIAAFDQAWRRLYGQDTEAVDLKIKAAVAAALVEYGIVVQPQ